MDTAVNLAHRYANEAEEQEERGGWTEAIDLHFKAADQFLLATKDTQNQEVVRTLKLMNANHNRQAKDLQRRVAKAAAAASAAAAAAAATTLTNQQKLSSRNRADGSAPQNSVDSPASSLPSSRRRGPSSQQEQGNSGGLGQRRHTISSQQSLGILGHESRQSGGGGVGGSVGGDAAGSGGSYLGTSSEASSNSSSAMVEESYTLIKNHAKDESDPFNKFWEAVENLVLKISNPVAITSIPLLDGDDPMQLNAGSTFLNSPTSEEPPVLSPIEVPAAGSGGTSLQSNSLRNVSHPGPGQPQLQLRQPRIRVDPSPMQESFFIIDSPSILNSQSKMLPRNRSASTSATESATLVHSSSSSRPISTPLKRADTLPRSTKTLEEYAIENQQLKLTLDKLSRRNLKLEKNLEGVMQMSVWTKDVQRSAMQLIKSQDILRPVKQSIQDVSAEKSGTQTPRIQGGLASLLPTLASGLPPHSSSSSGSIDTSFDQMNPTTMQARLKELTEELQQLKIENAKQNALMKKYKQRWEDLKESAKKRRNATPTLPAGADESGSSNDSPPSANQSVQYRSSAGSPNQSTRPLSNLARSSSASGPVVAGGGSYQRRIMMESKAGGLDYIPLNMNRQSSAGIVSSTSPRVLDVMSRTASSNPPIVVTGLPAVSSTLGFLPAVQETHTESDSKMLSPRTTPRPAQDSRFEGSDDGGGGGSGENSSSLSGLGSGSSSVSGAGSRSGSSASNTSSSPLTSTR
ncbi:hypothetical protein EMPS_11022 [Entomortierella parvispora]|uniref:MIT domain-containing protein n=1 Tax=Entomortierella parvispora TaxID=205924 RepID=A0A9P3HLR3_9FUNG|nr:hypothetical protein EMPS_11022 [Entomortierella parvispora]